MKKSLWALTLSVTALPCVAAGDAPGNNAEPVTAKANNSELTLDAVTVEGGKASNLPTQLPATIEGVTREEIATRINAHDSEDALKYLPSLMVRKRYIGDYNHAMLATRSSGTGNSVRSVVYADGILLSNFLGNGIANGTNYAPRWGLVTPEEIERVDVLYGPYSAAYAGNSAGAVVDYVTRMPTRFEAHVSAGYSSQPTELFDSKRTFKSWNTSASLGNKNDEWSWWLNLSRTDSEGPPQTFATLMQSAGKPGSAGTPVSGAVPGNNVNNQPWYVLGTGTQYHTVQDHIKAKVAYDITSTLRASYTLGWWQNESRGRPVSFLRNAAGQPVYSGPVNINGSSFNVAPTAFNLTNDAQTHWMHGLQLKSHTGGVFDWEVAASLYDYDKDRQRSPSTPLPGASNGGAGTLQSMDNSGWNTLAAKGIWRPDGERGAHIVEFGAGRDAYKLHIDKNGVTGDWFNGSVNPQAVVSNVGGRTQTNYLWAQDAWRFAPDWKAVLGLRWEDWEAKSGFSANPTQSLHYASRSESGFSPKAAVSWQATSDTLLRAAIGRAVRFPTAGELYGATSGGELSFINDPNLRPEKSWSGELSAEKDLGNGTARATLFHERLSDALISQMVAGTTISRVQNVNRVNTTGLELAYNAQNVGIRNLDVGGSITYANSRIASNPSFPASEGKWQPRVPRWRATALASYKPDDRWTLTAAARYSGKQYNTLDNSDVNAQTYFGVSKFFVVDLRAHLRVTKELSAAFGIDNVNNERYWSFHPMSQRTYSASLRWDL